MTHGFRGEHNLRALWILVGHNDRQNICISGRMLNHNTQCEKKIPTIHLSTDKQIFGRWS